jgi:hypothetical protein
MPTYRKADADDGVEVILDDLLRTYPRVSHLRAAGVTIGLLMAHASRNKDGEPNGCAVKAPGGAPALAVAKKINQADRADGGKDCRITVDGDRWPDLTPRQQKALVAHELLHFEVVLEESKGADGEGARVALDDCNRPKLKLRPHSWEAGGFNEIVEDFGDDAPEILALADCVKQAERASPGVLRQLSFGWDDAGGPAAEPAKPVGARAEKAARQFIDSLPAGTTATLSVDGMDPVTVGGPAGAA